LEKVGVLYLAEMEPLSIDTPNNHIHAAVRKSTIPGAVFNFLNSIVGAGIIGIPYAISESGFVTGIALLFLVSLITVYSVNQLILLARLSDTNSYESLVGTALHKPGSIAIRFFMFELAFGAMTIYFSIVGDVLPNVFGFGNRTTSLLLITVFLLPICLREEIDDLWITSALSITFELLMVTIIIVCFVFNVGMTSNAGNPIEYGWLLEPSLFKGLAIINFAFVCQHNSFLIYHSLENNTAERWSRVANWSVWLALGFCVILGLAGFIQFGNQSNANLLLNYDEDSKLLKVAQFSLCITLLLTFPIESFVARYVILAAFEEGCGYRRNTSTDPSHLSDRSDLLSEEDLEEHMQKKIKRRRAVVTLCLYGSALIISLTLYEYLATILAIVGATAASFLAFILPSFLTIVFYRRGNPAVLEAISKRSFQASCALLVFGIMALVLGLYEALNGV